MSEYLNKIGLLKYNNSTYKPVGQPQYYSVRDPGLVSSDPNTNFFNYPWRSDYHWGYRNYGQGWYYDGKNEIAYSFPQVINQISSLNPQTSSFDNSSYVYNIVPIHQSLLSAISGTLENSRKMETPQRLYVFEISSTKQLLSVTWNNDYRAQFDRVYTDANENSVSQYNSTYTVYYHGQTYPLIISGNLPPDLNIQQNVIMKNKYYTIDEYDCYYKQNNDTWDYIGANLNNVTPIGSSIYFHPDQYWPDKKCPLYKDSSNSIYVCYKIGTRLTGCCFEVDGNKIYGTMSGFPFIGQGSVNDIYSNELHFVLESPNLCGLDTDKLYYQQSTNGTWIYKGKQNWINDNNIRLTYQYNISFNERSCKVYLGSDGNKYLCYIKEELQTNIVSGLFHNIPGTDTITGICTTKMLFVEASPQNEEQYVYMRGLVRGKLNIDGGVTNVIAGPSTIIKKLEVTGLQGMLKNISDIPQSMKYGLDHYYAWGWLYGVDNITYKNVWYKNEISGYLHPATGSKFNNLANISDEMFIGTVSTSLITNNGTDDVVNILTGNITKDINSNILTGYLEGVIEPFSIHMKGFVSGYYNVSFNKLKPIQLNGILFNKSQIGKDLRQILDIKYANTLGRKQLTYPHALNGQNLNWSSKNYNPFDKPYMLQTWKIIEYKTIDEEIDYQNYIAPPNAVDLNTYIADKNTLKQYYKSRITKTEEELNKLLWTNIGDGDAYYVWWDKTKENNFVIRCGTIYEPNNPNITANEILSFKSVVSAQTYIKHLCSVSNLKLKDYKVEQEKDIDGTVVKRIINYVLDSSDLEIK